MKAVWTGFRQRRVKGHGRKRIHRKANAGGRKRVATKIRMAGLPDPGIRRPLEAR
jgi:hypothetical protein